MGEAVLKTDERFTYEQYLSWPDDERWELIDGQVYAMSPAPSFRHQDLALSIAVQLSNQLKGKRCKPMIAPFDVKLTEADALGNPNIHVVEPDVLVFCDPEKATAKGLDGAPDWVLEILSDSTSWKDQTVKLTLYERFGVKEYWVLNPETGLLLVHLLDGGKYGAPTSFLGPVEVPVKTLPGVVISLALESPLNPP